MSNLRELCHKCHKCHTPMITAEILLMCFLLWISHC